MSPEEFLLTRPTFHTRDFAHAGDISLSSASRWLGRRCKSGLLVQITRGVWASPKHPLFTPLGVVPYLLHNEQGYVSFLAALQRHGVISQLTARITVATTGHGRAVQTAVGTYQLIRIGPQYMQDGIVWHPGYAPYGMATAEKSLIDCLYVATRRGNQFAHFPELEWRALSIKRLNQLIGKHAFPQQIDVAVRRRLMTLRQHAERG